jgi:phosphomannomutase/phosphoglucomutase
VSADYNSASYFLEPLVGPTGFREYDARWVIEPSDRNGNINLNYVGLRQLGNCLGKFMQTELQAGRRIVVGHDYRRYSENVKNALVIGLLQAGMDVTDIGLSTTPGAYFAQFDLGIPCVAMITASHNENGWTGIKMGHHPASTFGPEEMARFRTFALAAVADQPTAASQLAETGTAGSYSFIPGFAARYIDDLVDRWRPRFEGLTRLKVAVETGNGTAGLYVPEILTRLGFEVAPGNVVPDWNFPHYNPNPESIPFLKSVGDLVRASGSDIGICVDGDGDRLGVVDNHGDLAFSDKVGLLIAKHLEAEFGTARPIVIDVKSTSLFESELKTPVVWAKTGHSYVKATVAKADALAGFERSGHFFFREPVGRGYDDACLASLAVLWVLCSARQTQPGITMSDLLAGLPLSFASPNRQPFAGDDRKYEIVDRIAAELGQRTRFAGREIIDINLLNGVRITLDDRSWLLVRASSNTPNLVIIAEVFDQDGALLRVIDRELRELIASLDVELGEFDPLYEF